MLSGIGTFELLLLFVIGLLILGPERLPRVAAQLGRWVGKARRTANQLRFQMEREITLAEIERKNKRNKNAEPRSTDQSAGANTDAPNSTEQTVADRGSGERSSGETTGSESADDQPGGTADKRTGSE